MVRAEDGARLYMRTCVEVAMKGIVIASHGALAQGLLDALGMLTGALEQAKAVGLVPEQDLTQYTEALRAAIGDVDTGEGAVVFCDLLFGSPCNCAASLLRDEKLASRLEVVCGANLPMLLEYASSRDAGMSVGQIVQVGRDGIVDLKERTGKHG